MVRSRTKTGTTRPCSASAAERAGWSCRRRSRVKTTSPGAPPPTRSATGHHPAAGPTYRPDPVPDHGPEDEAVDRPEDPPVHEPGEAAGTEGGHLLEVTLPTDVAG